MKFKLFSLILISMVFAGCSCQRYTNGIVADFETKMAIEGAQIYSFAALDGRIRDERYVYTNDTGWFETAFYLKTVAKCATLKLTISKDGYETIREVDMPVGDTVFLRKIK
ncbi:MAG: hypothetical protein H6551_13265 [Chitinophagales bacterium]|nr:hypothetical protein [Chitinophagaceae bacterium]MCB9066102.1 hypothetical protein [Chitinophagales bacterium]